MNIPSLSAVLYSLYAHETFSYFSLEDIYILKLCEPACNLAELSKEEQLSVMNFYIDHSTVMNEPENYKKVNKVKIVREGETFCIALQLIKHSIFKFSRTVDDSHQYGEALKKTWMHKR